MNKKLSDFIGLYQVSHTLTFELRPVGKTAEMLKKSGLLEQDFFRAEKYPEVKTILDGKHKEFLQKVFSSIDDIDWEPLSEKIAAFRNGNVAKDELEKYQSSLRKTIVDKFVSDDFYNVLIKESTPSKLFKTILADPINAPEEIKTFDRFACYFKGYQENRKNIYSAEAQQTAAAYRAVNENFPKFLSAVTIFSSFKKNQPDLVIEIENRTANLLNNRKLSDLFQIQSYNQFLPQSGIDYINNIIGEINYVVNQYRQQHKEVTNSQLPFMPVLFKQILSDRERAFEIKEFKNDSELCLALKKFMQNISQIEINGSCIDLLASLQNELKSLSAESNLFVDAGALENISKKITGNWSLFQEAMQLYAKKNFKTQKAQKAYCDRPVYHLNDIRQWDIQLPQEDGQNKAVDITEFWKGERAYQFFKTAEELASAVELLLSQEHENLRDDKEKVSIIKQYLDAILEIFHLLKPLVISPEYGGDLNLLGNLTMYFSWLEEIVPLYNHTRNYMLKKATDGTKVKLMFNKPTLADGWDNNKEQANLTVLLKKNHNFYLGIIAPSAQIKFENYIDNSGVTGYKKMIYKLLPGPNKMLPKVFFSQKNINFFAPSAELLNRYEHGDHLKGNNFDLSYCHDLIDFFKASIARHEDWSKFGFKYSPTHTYNGIDDFYKEVSEQGYALNFVNIPENTVTELVNQGKLYLFQIWNKDFSEKTTGTPNKFTLYWQALFNRENLADVVFKLNGEAELFMRPQTISSRISHAKGEKMVNRTIVTEFDDKNDKAIRTPLPENVHHEIFLFVTGRLAQNDMSAETRQYLASYDILNWKKGMSIRDAINKIVVKEANFDMIKDKRFTSDQYSFHVPITINFKSSSKPVKFNDRVLEYLRNNPDVKIIGLDRGERNLIYLTLIDQQGRILKQKSLNIINGVDYQEKLSHRAQERDSARKSWQEIGQIKDLKAGYLSGAVHEIAKMMVEENAIVVMEDLNFGFKRGRMKIEKQIYQKFERALIEKLNYLVFKDQKDHKAPGGVLAGYQLTGKFESFAKLGKQCGFIFYVPAGYTSKIDPVTGFINLFNFRECSNAETIKAFFNQFDTIRYSAGQDAFIFDFDYKKFKTYQKDYQNKWEVFSLHEAWQQEKNQATGRFSAVLHNPTEEIKTAISDLGLGIGDNFDLLALLRTVKAEASTAKFFRTVFDAFKLSVALRHSSKTEDKIISPVVNSAGTYFVSSPENESMPQDADANGAFHIALKGMFLLKHGLKDGKLGKITHDEWVKFAQSRHKN